MYLLFGLSLLFDPCRSALIAAGKIEQCINEDDDEELTDCETKAIITLSLTQNQGEVESLQTTLSEIEDKDGATKTLSDPWTITLSKSDVFIRFPLQYVQTFNAKPSEIVISTDSNLFGLNGCEDDPSSNPTCGFARSVDGDIITDSQGFCCSCSAFGTDTIRGLNGAQCSMFGDDVETAHCLNFESNPLWYSAYDLGAAEIYFEILVTIKRGNNESYSMILSPSNTGSNAMNGRLVARLIGDLASYSSTLSMDDFYFFVPSSPSTNERVLNWLQNSMLIDKNGVSLDGRECDKIGVSYHAFRYQSDKCLKQSGDCLNNQIEDYHLSGEHFVNDIVGANVVMLQDTNSNQIYFSFVTQIMQTSLVTLSISTDDISFVVNRANGNIQSCAIDNFESLAAVGLLQCIVENEGAVEAMFRLSVTNCSNGIKPIQNKQFTIQPMAKMNFSFDVYSENAIDSTHECTVKLFDSLEAKIDEKKIEFLSSELNEDRGAQEGYGQNSGSSTSGNAVIYSCESHCDSFFDIRCFVMRECWTAIAKLVGVIIAILFLPCFVKFASKRIMRAMNESQRYYDDDEGRYDSVSRSRSRSKKRRKHKKEKGSKKKKKKRRKRRVKSESPSKKHRNRKHKRKAKRKIGRHKYLTDLYSSS